MQNNQQLASPFSNVPFSTAISAKRTKRSPFSKASLIVFAIFLLMNSVSAVFSARHLSQSTRRHGVTAHSYYSSTRSSSLLAFVSNTAPSSKTEKTVQKAIHLPIPRKQNLHIRKPQRILNPLFFSTNTASPANDTIVTPAEPTITTTTTSKPYNDPTSPDSYAIPRTTWGQDDLLTNLRPNQRIVSFGDVHGDLNALLSFLNAAQVLHPDSTPTNPIWNGGDTILVQCGDILDRGAEELSCLRILTSLARQAPADGGKVFLLHGNHEALNANGLFQYADPGGNVEIEETLGKSLDEEKSEGTPRWRIQYAGNEASRWTIFEPGGWLSRPLYSQMPVVVVVGKTCFVHAGLTKEHLVRYGGVEGMNSEVKAWFETEIPEDLHNDDGYKFRTVEDVIENAQLRARTFSKSQPECLGGGIGASSPVWMRDYSSPGDAVPKSPNASLMMKECLEEFQKRNIDVQRMVMGHTPQRQINSALDGRAWRVDVGASKGVMNGTPEVLEIIHQGGENDEDLIHILTTEGKRIPATERQTIDLPF